MEEELAELRQQLQEEQRRREGAEELAETSQPQTLGPYLEACHSLHLAIQVVTDRSSQLGRTALVQMHRPGRQQGGHSRRGYGSSEGATQAARPPLRRRAAQHVVRREQWGSHACRFRTG